MTAMYNGLGLGSGALTSGFAYKNFGPEIMFVAAACIVFLAFMVFAISNAIPRKKDRTKARVPRIAINSASGGNMSPVISSVRNIALPADPLQSGPLIQPEVVDDDLYIQDSESYDGSPRDAFAPYVSDDLVREVKGVLDE